MIKKKRRLTLLLALILSLCLVTALPAFAEVKVVEGVTPIDNGMANNEKDFTVINDKIALSFAVGSSNFWNMTNGSVLDIAVVKDGKIGTDLVNDVEFLNNFWTATGSYNGENLLQVSPENITYKTEADKVVVTAKTRYWTDGHKLPLNVTIEYTILDGKNYVPMKTTVSNPEGNDTYKDMYSGYSISTLAANMFGPFGYYPDKKITGIRMGSDSRVNDPNGDFVVTYGKNYAVSVQLDNADAYKGSSGYKDIYTLRDIEPGKTYVYTGEILINDSGSTTPIIERYLEKNPQVKYANVSGIVKDSKGKSVADAYVVISREGSYVRTPKSDGALTEDKLIKGMQPLAWAITDASGKYSFKLPENEYRLHAESKGYSPSKADTLKVESGKDLNLDFTLTDGAHLIIKPVDQNGKPIPARISFPETKMDIKTVGSTVFFTDPKTNIADFNFPASDAPVVMHVDYGKDFTSRSTVVEANLKAGEVFEKTVVVNTEFFPEKDNWYSCDNHQHSNVGDGATSPYDLYKAQRAAKLDIAVISDHDFTGNNKEFISYAKEGNMPYISAIEVSPGWGHWGVLNMPFEKDGQKVPVISPSGTPKEIIDKAHELGGTIVVHHPYSDYGFFFNQAGVKGGDDPGAQNFDLIELQPTIDLTNPKNWDKRTLDDIMFKYWNKGNKKYLSAGSDQHDVTSGLYPGIIRMYAYLPDGLTADKYIDTLKKGHAYMTMGPLVTPAKENMFGDTITIKPGEALKLKFKVESVNGIKTIDLYENGKIINTVEGKAAKSIDFTPEVKPAGNSWYNVVVLDENGKYAVTNPVWVSDGSSGGVSFLDVQGTWAEPFVKNVYENRWMIGVSESHFGASAPITRGDFVVALSRYAKAELNKDAKVTFSDLQGSSYVPAVAWAVEKGIINGYENNTFKAKNHISRQEMAKIFAQYMKAYKISGADAEPVAFSDSAKIAPWAKEGVDVVSKNKIATGRDGNVFDPTAKITRAEVAKMISQLSTVK